MVQIMTSFLQQTTVAQRHICRVCEKTFRASSLLDIHMRVHVGAKPFVCPKCGHRATQKGNLKLHMKKHHGMDLPPSIDMEPDSGIWRDTEEFAMTGNSNSNSPNCDLSDDPKKKKVITQAMSSLLDPYVVELIKRCQNSVGQGMTGRITESLKDFIQAAEDNVVDNYGVIKRALPQQENRNSVSVITSARNSHKMNNVNVIEYNTFLEQRKENETLNRKRSMSNSEREVSKKPRLLNQDNQNPTLDKDAINFYQERLRNLTYRTGLQDKEKFLSYLKLYRYNVAMENEIKHQTLRPVQSLHDKPILIADDLKYTVNSSNEEKVKIKTEGKSESKSDGSARVSPGVLQMLRKTILSSVEQKIARTNSVSSLAKIQSPNDATRKAPENLSKVFETRNEAISSVEEFSPTMKYASPAMTSLAAIGKSLSVAPAAIIRRRSESPDHSPSSDVGSVSFEDLENSNSLLGAQNATAFRCQFCPKIFKYRSVLEIHMRSHTGERPYKCNYCEYAGTQHNCLKLHIQRHHPNEYIINHADLMCKGPGMSISQPVSSFSASADCKATCLSPVNCPICGRVSPSPGYLKIHMRSHKKSLDHVCHICGRGFKEYWYLSTHLKTHEREMTSLKVHSNAIAFRNLFRPAAIQDSNLNYNNNLSLPSYLLQTGEHSVFTPLKKSPDPEDFKEKDKSTPLPEPFVSANVMRITSPIIARSDEFRYLRSETPHASRRKSSFPTRVLVNSSQTPESNDEEEIKSHKKPRHTSKRFYGDYLTPPLSKLPYRTTSYDAKGTNSSGDDSDDEKPLDLSIRSRNVSAWSQKYQKSNSNAIEESKPINLCTISTITTNVQG